MQSQLEKLESIKNQLNQVLNDKEHDSDDVSEKET